jgi:hypothetical protein
MKIPPLWTLDPERLPGALRRLGTNELHLWVPGWLADRARKRGVAAGVREAPHLLFSVCDHYEPLHGGASLEQGVARVAAWRSRYPEMAAGFVDDDGRSPRHSWFYPGEQYDPRLVEPLGEMCERGLGEVEVHLHHDGDTRETLRASLEKTLEDLGSHGVIARRRITGRPAWAFIHGNWCLANARRDGRYCGVDDEMDLLYELGCYVDLTFPSAPDGCQPGLVNTIFYPRGDVRLRRAYEDAERVRVGTPLRDRLLLIEGPIALARRPGTLKPRIESAALDASDPPTAARLRTWIDQWVHVEGRPEWVFVKVHTHGAPEKNAEVMLGERVRELHRALAACRDGSFDGRRWKLHYLTAREMYNVARAAMDGLTGDPSGFFDYEIPPPPRATARSERRPPAGSRESWPDARP